MSQKIILKGKYLDRQNDHTRCMFWVECPCFGEPCAYLKSICKIRDNSLKALNVSDASQKKGEP